jgi:hypothetical protein
MTREKFELYEQVRQSGVTNMFNTPLVCELTGLTKAECYYIMKNYSKLAQIFHDVVSTDYPRKTGIVNLNRL